ncbi:hypothetical protein FEM48_Zijuj08G0067400 [Ziziphus jujuba var. spinosa]|uniref:Non-haem dioxygenase N-terminal domain-containing protein n=1 Tax=Ziziphus jujuba var. spinosa TaxID=714518 RepID=A0A978UXK5_ZIZJJ|nr:hypothetical protein FEM48_Zijuj08G0067400 [Ziziphus jujuba var. spinosa]
MAETSPLLVVEGPNYKPTINTNYSKDSIPITSTFPTDKITAVDDKIPTVDYFMLLSDDPDERSLAIKSLSRACEDYGFFHLVNHGVPDSIFEGVFKGISDFFDPDEVEDRKQYEKKHPTDRIRWGLRSYPGENREYLKVVVHPQFHCPPKPVGFSEAMEEYFKRLREVVHGLAKALSKTLGLEEGYIEKAFNLESGFDVSAMNLYPPNFRSKGSVGVPDHTDPGLFVSLICDILSNGKYKSHVHRVVLEKNKVKRISVATLHGPSLDTFVSPAIEFVDKSHRPAYRGMTYKQSLEANGGDEIDVQSNIEHLRLA